MASKSFEMVNKPEGITDTRYLVVSPFVEFANRAAELLGLQVRIFHGNGKNLLRDCSNIEILSSKNNSLQLRDIIVGVAVRDKSVLYLGSDVDFETEHGSISHQAGLRIISNVLCRQYPDKAKEIDSLFDDVVEKYNFPSISPIQSFIQDLRHSFRVPDYDY